MKILHIVEFGKRFSGIGTVVERLQKEQLALGHDVRIVSIAENIAYRHLDITTCLNGRDFNDFLTRWQPDAVLFHSIWALPYIKFAKVLKKLQIPYAIMMHGADSKANRQSAPLKKWIANVLWFNHFMKDAAAVVYLCQAEIDNCLSAKNNQNNVIIPNGCDQGLFDAENICIHSPVNIIYLGRLTKLHKGIDVLLDALDILKTEKFHEAKISFYANENDIDLQYLLDRLSGLKDVATYCGSVYNDKKKQVLRDADAFILTSRFEGMPMGVLEAISYGIPCILTPGTNMSDELLAAGAGWKTEFNSYAIARNIKKAVNDLKENYRKYHQAAYTQSAIYDWKEIANKHVNLMMKISKYHKNGYGNDVF